MQKISEWLGEMDGHTALSVELARPAFEKATGKTWPDYLKGEPVREVLERAKDDIKGLQYWKGDASHHVIGGWQIACALAEEYVKFHSSKLGRGSAFRDCLEALRGAGL